MSQTFHRNFFFLFFFCVCVMTKVLKFNYVSIIFPAVSKVTKKKEHRKLFFYILFCRLWHVVMGPNMEEWGGLFGEEGGMVEILLR